MQKEKNLLKQRSILDKMRRDFVANVSHELRTPLTVMHGYLEILLDKKAPETDKKNLLKIFAQMYQQTTRMENIITDLLLLSNLEGETNKRDAKKELLLAPILKSVCKEAKILSGDANHQFFLKLDNRLKIKGEAKELRSLMSNIIFNAVRYTPANGCIYIDLYAEQKHIYFKVRDTGIGIAKKHIPRLTERFYRVDKARSRETGGTGLGLAIVKHILLHFNAHLEVTSKLGVGSNFICIFPYDK
jgi:two-component system phosphate regulon sensor histidine kinase PhoR